MNRLLKLAPDVPVEIALSCADGVNVLSPRGTPAVKYNLVDGRIFFATTYVAAKLRNLKVEAHERIALCMRNIDGKSITLVERVPAAEFVEANPPATSTIVDGTVINQQTEHPPDPELIPPPTDENDPSPTTAEPLNVLRDGSANEEQTPPISQLERALKTAILAAHSAEQYGTEIGYAVRFDQESVKCMAITVLIGLQGGRY